MGEQSVLNLALDRASGQPPYLWRESPRLPLDMMGPRGSLNVVAKRNSLPCQESNLGRPVFIQSLQTDKSQTFPNPTKFMIHSH